MYKTEHLSVRALRTALMGERLTLRRPQASDSWELHNSYLSDLECARFLQRSAVEEEAHSVRLLTRLDAALLENGEGIFGWVIAVGQPGVPVGLITCIAEGHAVQIHYGLAKSHWGKGLATEAVKLAVDELLDCGRFDRIYTTCAAEHLRSRVVLEKCGFEAERLLPQALTLPALGEAPRDGVRYVRLSPQLFSSSL
ncbi:MAG: N-acetyltransferase [Alcaligenaceae bacterium]|nr:MAG: N-acetyltransferase [Alcaligenaceae bacterium]